ncbi:MAG: sucrase ferredoxin [Dermatophilaceae bacterium]
MALTDLSRCSAASRHRADPIAGTAPHAVRWLLVEHRGPWATQPLETPPLLGQLGSEIDALCGAFQGKVLLVRRPGSRPAGDGVLRWFAVDTARRTWVRGIWRTVADLVVAARSLGHELATSEDQAPPMVLVCTHGTRDACCAVRGRPIVAALAREWPDDVWECTHLGGHRFAGTLLSLPDGTCFGRLDTDTAPRVLTEHRAGRTHAKYLRGGTRHEPVVQAAVAAVLERFGPAGLSDAEPGVVDIGQGGRSTVDVLGDGPVPDRCVVEVTEQALPDAPLSCGGGPKPHLAYRTTVRVAGD